MDTGRTLLLSQSYEPVATISWQRAIILAVLEKAEIVEEYEDVVRSVRSTMRKPAVVRLVKAFRRHKRRVKFSKQHVFARDRYQCQYCRKRKAPSDLTYDHVVPRSRGGKTSWENIVTACTECNARKADRTPEEARMFPRTAPQRPEWLPTFSMKMSGDLPDLWKPYCYWMK